MGGKSKKERLPPPRLSINLGPRHQLWGQVVEVGMYFGVRFLDLGSRARLGEWRVHGAGENLAFSADDCPFTSAPPTALESP